jgi:hypothetical protein
MLARAGLAGARLKALALGGYVGCLLLLTVPALWVRSPGPDRRQPIER